MIIPLSHHRNHPPFPSHEKRLLFKLERAHFVHEDEVGRAEKNNVEELRAEIDRVKQILQEETAKYNTQFARRKPEADHEKRIALNFDDLEATQQTISEIETSIQAQRNENGELSRKFNSQLTSLTDIRDTLPRLALMESDLAQMEGAWNEGNLEGQKEYAHRSRLRRKYERIQEGQRTLASWEENPFYKEVVDHFEIVANNKEYASLWQTPEGFSTAEGEQMKNLFLAMMAQETNNFKTPLLFGENFGDNHEENIKNYPFIYNEWLKRESGIGLSLELIQDAENDAELLASRVGNVRTIEQIIEVGGESSGMDQESVNRLKVAPKDEAWAERAALIHHFIENLRRKSNETDNDPQKAKSFTTLIEELEIHRRYAEAKARYFELLSAKEVLNRNFTRGYFSQEPKQKMAIELAMKKFQKSAEMLDQPMGKQGGEWQRYLHPTVRRLLVASFYRSEADNFALRKDGQVRLRENLNGVKADMIAAMNQSDYFNATEIGRNLDSDHRFGLKVIELGFQLDDFVQDAAEPIQVIDLYIKAKQTSDQGALNEIITQLSQLPPKYVKAYASMGLEDLQNIRGEYEKNVGVGQEYFKGAIDFLKNPSSKDSQAFLERIKSGELGREMQSFVDGLSLTLGITAPKLAAYEVAMQGIEINFNALELKEVNDMKFFERLGINLEGIYPFYIEAIKEHPEMSIDHWNEYLLSKDPAEFEKLAKFLEDILPEDIAGGKEDFMVSFRSLHQQPDLAKYLANPEIAGDHAVTFAIFTGIKEHLKLRREAEAFSDRGEKERAAKLNGMHIGDKVSKYGREVWNMLVGPGQSWANRAAAFALIYGFYKSANMALKGEGKTGQFLRVLFVGGAVEIAAKNITGRGILDRFGLDAIAGAMEGTYEGVLLKEGDDFRGEYDITEEEHAGALAELNDVPMADLLTWYETTDENGAPLPGQPDKFPPQIQVGQVVKGTSWREENKGLRARRVTKLAVRDALRYVGDKDDHRGPEHGFNVMKERYVTLVKDPTRRLKNTEFWQKFYKVYGDNPNKLTWRVAIRSEIDPQEVELTKNQTWVGELETTAQEVWEGSADWIRKNVYNPGSGYAEVFFTKLGEGARETSETLGDLAEALGTKLHFTKETVSLWYNSNKYEIIRLADQHWQLAVEGVKLPFKLIYGVDQLVMPYVLSKIQQIDAVLSDQNNVSIKDRGLEVTDIVSDPTVLGVANVELNPQYTYFGEYQVPFKEAFEANDKFKLDVNNIGYYISNISTQDANINLQDETFRSNPNNVDRALIEASRKKAIDEFEKRGMGMTREEIATYLYEIHTIDRTTEPPTKYMFWRLPLPGSAELQLRRSGKWADFADPNRFRERGPFILDPSKTDWENFMAAMALDMDPVRNVASGVMGYAAQVPRLAFANVEFLGSIAKFIAKKVMASNPTEAKRIEDAMNIAFVRPESQRIWIDEFFTSGKDKQFALSQFYRDPFNASLYELSLDYAQDKDKRLYLGLLEGRPGYEGELYIKPVEEDPFVKMKKYYLEEWSRTEGRKLDPRIVSQLDAKIAGK